MDPIARAGVHVGMSEIFKGYIIYYPDTLEFEAAIHCDFDEAVFPMREASHPEPPLLPLPVASLLPPVAEPCRLRFEPPDRVPPPEGGMPSPPA